MDTSIQFAENTSRGPKSQGVGGVVPVRARTRSLSRARSRSFDTAKTNQLEDAEDEDAGLRDERDYKKKQVWKGSSFAQCKTTQSTDMYSNCRCSA